MRGAPTQAFHWLELDCIEIKLVTVKMNYEIHGNSIPHLHMHFFPRYRGDQFEGQPINPRLVVQPVYAPAKFERVRDAFVAAHAR